MLLSVRVAPTSPESKGLHLETGRVLALHIMFSVPTMAKMAEVWYTGRKPSRFLNVSFCESLRYISCYFFVKPLQRDTHVALDKTNDSCTADALFTKYAARM